MEKEVEVYFMYSWFLSSCHSEGLYGIVRFSFECGENTMAKLNELLGYGNFRSNL